MKPARVARFFRGRKIRTPLKRAERGEYENDDNTYPSGILVRQGEAERRCKRGRGKGQALREGGGRSKEGCSKRLRGGL